jgi:micrococcal nuclease
VSFNRHNSRSVVRLLGVALVASACAAGPVTSSTSVAPDDGPTGSLEDASPASTVTRAPAAPSGGVEVVAVIDGDTIDVRIGDTVERLRLIGIDAPERLECGAEEAAALLIEIVGGTEVYLEADTSDRDVFGRLLRYVWIGDMLVNEALVESGLAIARRYPPDLAHTERLEEAQIRAQGAAVGLWSGAQCGTAQELPVVISTINYDAPGDDNHNLNGEWVEFTNTGDEPFDLGGWAVRDESSRHRYPFPAGFVLAPGATVRLHTGCGADTTLYLYWCNTGSAVWNNTGDTVFVLDPAGNIAVSRSYVP